MTFTQQLIATLIGTFSGFVGSLVIFWIKELWSKSQQEESLKKNLLYELDYNINLYEKYIEEITGAIEELAKDNHIIFLNNINYQIIGKFHAHQFYQSGVMIKYLDIRDMNKWNDLFVSLQDGSEKYMQEHLTKWRSKDIEKELVLSALKMERSYIKSALDTTKYIKTKITS